MEEENEEEFAFKYDSGIDQQQRNLTIFQKVNIAEMNQVECVTNCTMPSYTPFVSFLCPKAQFQTQSLSLSWSVTSADSGEENIPLFRHADLFLGRLRAVSLFLEYPWERKYLSVRT